jgi:xanthine dehydrogenase accessory factor
VNGQLLDRAAALRVTGQAFVLATVVRSVKPASAKPGDTAILVGGALEGWVGGGCVQTCIATESKHALADGRPRLVRLSPDADPARAGFEENGILSYPMTCHSGGSLEIYVEPYLPPPRLVVVGDAPVAQALVSLGSFLGYDVTAVAPDATDRDFPDARRVVRQFDDLRPELDARSYLVLASVGDYDEQALEQAISADPAYIAVVASPRRAAALREYLSDRDVPEATVAKVKAPAGLDIGAVEPEEIALSIMAEIVELRRRSDPSSRVPQAGPETAIDPVCGMSVEIAGARHVAEFDGQKVYFCCPACKRRFVQERAGSR